MRLAGDAAENETRLELRCEVGRFSTRLFPDANFQVISARSCTSQKPTLGWRLMNAPSCRHQRPPRSNLDTSALCKMFVIRATKQSAEFGYGGFLCHHLENLPKIVLEDGVMYEQPWAIWLTSTQPM